MDIGGGIFNYQGGQLSIVSSNVSSNTAGSGGGIYNEAGGIATIESTNINNNQTNQGGGILSKGSLTLKDSTVSGNITSIWGFLNYGGGLYNGGNGSMTIENTTIADTQSKYIKLPVTTIKLNSIGAKLNVMTSVTLSIAPPALVNLEIKLPVL